MPVYLWLFACIVFWTACLAVQGFWRFVKHWPFPYDYAFDPTAHHGDFVVFTGRFHYVHSVTFFSPDPALGAMFQYPAPAALLYLPFQVSWHALTWYTLANLLGLLALWLAFRRVLLRLGIAARVATLFLAAALLFSYPFWFVFIQGNIELLLFLILACGILAFMRGNTMAAAVLISAAGSIKLYPFLLLGLLLSRKNSRALAVGLLTAAALTVVSLWILCPSIPFAWRGIAQGLAINRNAVMAAVYPVITGWDHSLFAAVKSFYHQPVESLVPQRLLTHYLAAAALFGLAIYFGRILRLPLLNRIVSLYVCAILLPPTSYDYTLIHLYIPWFLLIVYAIHRQRTGQTLSTLTPAFLCLAVAMSPFSEFIHHGFLYGAQVKCAALLALLCVALIQPWPGLEDAWQATKRLDTPEPGKANLGFPHPTS